ncbi:hypothetical protein [Variovorax atrisoli]|uniref:hypothetical protein n=1 Tax=Variovorax atrisoli TaxID=3394203 RepID=UPI00035C2233|nr:hypothetical protein [Variovorax paradoxus]
MSHTKGTRLDGIATLEDLRQRCVIDEESGCWHLRTARGRALPQGPRHVIWVFGIGHTTATRASWLLAHPKRKLRNGWVCYRTCESYDCVAPKHIVSGTRKAWGEHMAASGKGVTAAKTKANQTDAKSTWKLTPELKQWLLESPQSGIEVAHALGIAQGRANAIRAKERAALIARPASSVFEFAQRHTPFNLVRASVRAEGLAA